MTEGQVQFISHERNGVKIVGEENWFNAKTDPVKKALKDVKKNDKVEYTNNGKTLTYIKVSTAAAQPADTPAANVDLDKEMKSCVNTVMEIAKEVSAKCKDTETPMEMDWTKLAITLFISKTGRGK